VEAVTGPAVDLVEIGVLVLSAARSAAANAVENVAKADDPASVAADVLLTVRSISSSRS